MKKLLLVVLLLAGCSNSAQFFAGQQLLVNELQKVEDEKMAVATFAMCNAVTVGAWMRAYGSDATKADAWRVLCAKPVTQTPAK